MDKAIYMAVNSIKADKIKQINAVHEVANVSHCRGFKKAFDLTVETYRVDLPGLSLQGSFYSQKSWVLLT